MKKMNDNTLERRRRFAADCAFEDADFGDVSVEAHNGWETEGDRFTKLAFMDVGGDETVAMTFAVEFLPGTAELASDPEFETPEAIAGEGPCLYGYYINLDERGEFFADVKGIDDRSVFEIDTDTIVTAIEDGFMDHKSDIVNLQAYLRQTGFIEPDAELLTSAEFEKRSESCAVPTMGL